MTSSRDLQGAHSLPSLIALTRRRQRHPVSLWRYKVLFFVGWALAVAVVASGDEACVSLTSHPAHAKVFVNGYFKGFTPCTVSISSAQAAPQQYRLTLLLAGYQKWDKYLSLTAGATQTLNAQMQKLPDPLVGKTICIDPGHPSETSAGTKGPSGVTENHINWVIALQLKSALIARGVNVVLTKSAENQKVTNRRRAQIANENNSDIMIRLHCDAAPNSGFTIYYPDRQGERYGVTGPAPAVINASRCAAALMYQGMKEVLTGHLTGRGIHGDSATYIGSRQGALTGSIFSQVPVLTIEMCVLTNASDEQFIVSLSGQQLMMQALQRGLEIYFGEN